MATIKREILSKYVMILSVFRSIEHKMYHDILMVRNGDQSYLCYMMFRTKNSITSFLIDASPTYGMI